LKESRIQRDIFEYLNIIGAYTIKGDANSKIGTPDILACLNGYFVAIEIKKPTKKPRLNQLKQMQQIKKAKGIAFYATSVKDVIAYLKEIV